MMFAQRRPSARFVRTRPLLVAASVLLAALPLLIAGCGSGAAPGAAPDEATAATAEQTGLSVEERMQKKQMLMDQGLWGEEIEKALAMGGGVESLFKDDAQSNRDAPASIGDVILFSSEQDGELRLRDEIGKSNLVLVFTRGYSGGGICPFCSAQTAQLAARRADLEARDARVLVIYPGSAEHLGEFNDAVAKSNPTAAAEAWPVLLDKDLAAVNLLDIAADLASPSTFVIDKQGQVVFTYVGANRADRPSVKAILEQLDALQPAAG